MPAVRTEVWNGELKLFVKCPLLINELVGFLALLAECRRRHFKFLYSAESFSEGKKQRTIKKALSRLMTTYERILSALNKGKIDYLVAGGVAVNLYGFMRSTGDLDIVLALDENNLVRMDGVMKKLKFQPRAPIQLGQLSQQKVLQKLITEKNMQAYTFQPLDHSILEVDVLTAESQHFADYKKRSITMKINKTIIPLINIKDLIAMKKKTGRTTDKADIDALNDLQ